nr:TIGR03545 family protein [uncultured Glaciecola sp.]
MFKHRFSTKSQVTQQGRLSLWLSIPLGTIAGIFILYFLFANTLLKTLATNALGDASGAEVNIDSIEHGVFPFSLTLNRLQATDNNNPSRNRLEVARVKADVDFIPLLNKKLIVNELIVQDVEFDTQRESAGAVYVQPDAQASNFAFPTLSDLPSVDQILEKSPLKTTAAVAEAQKVVQQYQQPLQDKYAALPSTDKLTTYKERLKALQKIDYKNPVELAAAKKEFDEIKQAIIIDKTNITEFTDLAKEAKAASANSLSALKTAPQEDFDLLKGLVAGDEGAIGQVTQHLFGEKAKIYTQGLLAAMAMLSSDAEEPVIEDTALNDGLPNVWIKKAAVNIKWQDEQIETVWQNITDQHALIGNPTTFLINSSQAENWRFIDLKGTFEIIQGQVNSVQDWDINGLVLDAIELVPEESKQKLNALLESGLLASKGGLKVVDGKLSGSSVIDLRALKLKATGKNDLTSAMADVISGLSNLSLTTDFSGSLTSPSIKIKSDLDKKMLQALSSGLTGNSSGKLRELKSKLNAKVAEQLGQSGQQLESVDALLAAAQGDAESLNELLKSQMTNALDQKKDKLLNKLTDKLIGNE